MRIEEKIILGLDLEMKLAEAKGIKGFLIRKVWPYIKNELIDLLIDFLEKKRDA